MSEPCCSDEFVGMRSERGLMGVRKLVWQLYLHAHFFGYTFDQQNQETLRAEKSMASDESEKDGDHAGLDIVNMAKENAMSSVDLIKNSLGISKILGLCVNPLIHAVDVGSDMNLAYQYYSDNEYLYAALTGSFVAVPTILVSLLQKMYFEEFQPASILKWLLRIVMMILPFSPIISSFQALNHVRFLKKTVTDFTASPDLDKFDAFKKRYDRLVAGKSTAAMLAVAEGFLQSAPQLVLQISILLSREKLVLSGNLYASLVSSFLSVLKAYATYNNSLEKRQSRWINTVLLYLWTPLIIGSRVFAISQGMSVSPIETLIICLVHWYGMTTWLAVLEKPIYSTPVKQGKLGKLIEKIPLQQVGELKNVGIQKTGEAFSKVGGLTNSLLRREGEEENAEEERPGDVEQGKDAVEEGVEANEEEKLQDGKPKEESRFTLKKLFFSAVFGLIYIFVYVPVIEKPTRNKYAFFYFVWFLETCFFLVIGCQELLHHESWLLLGLRVATLAVALIGLAMMTFYLLYHNRSSWAKKNDALGGFGLETITQYGLSGLKKIDPSQLIPLNSIDTAKLIPKLDSLSTAIPGAKVVSELQSLSDTISSARDAVSAKKETLTNNIPKVQAISGLLTSGKEENTVGGQLLTGLISKKDENSSCDNPGAELISGVVSKKEGENSDSCAIPGAGLISGLVSKEGEDSDSSTMPGAGLISGLSSKKEEDSDSSAIPGAGLISGLVSKKEEDSDSSAVPGTQLISGFLSGKEEEKEENISNSTSDKKESLPGSISGLISKVSSEKEEEGGSEKAVPESTPGEEDNSSSDAPSVQKASKLISEKQESLSSSIPVGGAISKLVPGKGGKSFGF